MFLKQRHLAIYLITAVTLIASSCTSSVLQTPCTPIDYPTGTNIALKNTDIIVSETDDKYIDVVSFYEQRLANLVATDTYGSIKWAVSQIDNGKILFECGSVLNSYESELGCILIYEKGNKTIIEITWSYSEVAAIPCNSLPGY